MPSGTSRSCTTSFSRVRSCADGDLAADAAAARGVGHQHRIAAGQRQIGGQRRALVAALFLDHLHQHDLAALDDFLDLVLARGSAARVRHFFQHVVAADGFDHLPRLRRRRRSSAAVVAAPCVVVRRLRHARRRRFGRERRRPRRRPSRMLVVRVVIGLARCVLVVGSVLRGRSHRAARSAGLVPACDAQVRRRRCVSAPASGMRMSVGHARVVPSWSDVRSACWSSAACRVLPRSRRSRRRARSSAAVIVPRSAADRSPAALRRRRSCTRSPSPRRRELRWRGRRRSERFSASSSASRWARSSASISACRSATGI